MTFDMEERVRLLNHIRIALRTARYSVQALVNEPRQNLDVFPFFDRELTELQRDVWELVQARESWKAAQREARFPRFDALKYLDDNKGTI